jgi:hypothetical protein
MDQSDGQSRSRPWREVADEVTNEQDPSRVQELSKELITALDEQSSLCHRDGKTMKKQTKVA